MQTSELMQYTGILCDCFKTIDEKEKTNPDYYTKLNYTELSERLLYELGILFKKDCDRPHDKLLSDIEKQRLYRNIIILCMITIRRIDHD